MSSYIWVCKSDGSAADKPNAKKTTLDDARELLADLIGPENILKGEKRDAGLNAFEITAEGYRELLNGIIGPDGWVQCEGATSAEDSEALTAEALPPGAGEGIIDLLGNPLRVYRVGESIGNEKISERVNIALDEDGLIVNVWFG